MNSWGKKKIFKEKKIFCALPTPSKVEAISFWDTRTDYLGLCCGIQ